VTTPLPNDAPTPQPPPRPVADVSAPDPSPEPGRERAKIARKWAYLLCATTYVPLVQSDLEEPLRTMVDDLFDTDDHLAEAERIGRRLVELNCVDRKSVQMSIDVLATPLLAEHQPERVTRMLGALASGYAEALRQRTTDQQESMIRAVKTVATKAALAAKAHREERDAVATELSLLRRQLSHQLLHDAVTGLPNRQFFTTRLEEVLNSGSPTTLYRLELNGFTVVDDGLGGPAADALLVSIATRLRSALAGTTVMLARLDRAGFAVLLEPERDPLSPEEVVGRINDVLSDATYVDDQGLALSASIGAVQSPPHGTDPAAFLRAADLALAVAKERGSWQVLTPTETAAAGRLLRLAAIMPGAVEMGQLAVEYRMQVSLADERPVAVDAYPTWSRAGLVGDECVALAEQTGLSPQVGRWLLRAAGEQVRTLGGGLPLAVRLSANQAAAPDLVDSVLGTLSDVSLPPGKLRLAMPAAEVFDGRPQAMDNLAELTKAGVGTAVHDFAGSPSDVMRLPDLSLKAVSLAPRLVAQARTIGTKSLMTQALTSLTALVHAAGATVSVDDLCSEPEVEWWRRAGADIASGPLFPIRGKR
jgi:diguanylate cyclase (GGDEF)-like protein